MARVNHKRVKQLLNEKRRGTYYEQLQYAYGACGRGAPLTEYCLTIGCGFIATLYFARN